MTVSYQRYDRLAGKYDKAIGPLERWFLRWLRQEAIDALPAGARIVELGAGTGQNFSLYEHSLRVIATEPSTGMLQMAKSKLTSSSLQLVQSCAETLPFADNSFDGALATLVLCSVQSPELVFAELRRVVRPGGTISLLEHVRPDGVLGPIFDLLNLLTVPLMDDHFNRRTCKLASQSGLQIKKVRKVGWGTMNVITLIN
jgi:ubiquinone/menaquinone biosynthesis C-methylase UbiE